MNGGYRVNEKNEKKKCFIMFVVGIVFGVCIGWYLFGGFGTNVHDLRETVNDLGDEQQGIDDTQQRAAGAIDNAQRASQSIADGVGKLQAGTDRSAAILRENEAIYQQVRAAGRSITYE